MKRPEFLETKRTPRYSLRKLNVGVASVLLGVTIFGINFTDHSVKAATPVEGVGNGLPSLQNSNPSQTFVLKTTEQTNNQKTTSETQKVQQSSASNDATEEVQQNSASNNTTANNSTEAATTLQSAPKTQGSAGSGASGSSATGVVSGSASNSQSSESANSGNATSSPASQVGTVSANQTSNTSAAGAPASSDQTVTVDETTLPATQAAILSTNLARLTNFKVGTSQRYSAILLTNLVGLTNSGTDTTLPTTTQTYTKVDQPLLYDYLFHTSGTGTRDRETWVDKTVDTGVWDYPSYTLDTIFGKTSKPGIITSNPDKYFFAAYVDFSEQYHRVILLARSQDPSDKNLYSYTIHTYRQKTSTTTIKPGDNIKEQYTGVAGSGGSKYDLIFHNYGDSFTVKLNNFDGKWGMLPVFDGGLLDPTYGSNSYKQNDTAAQTEPISFWASAIPQKTSTKVRYVDQATGKDIVQPMEISGFGYQGFKVKGDAPTVKGYHLVSKPEFLPSTNKASAYEDGTISPYEVGQTYDLALSDSVVIKQTVIDTNGTVRATAYYNGSRIPSTSASKVLGRESYNDKMSFGAPDGKFYTYTNRIGQVDGSYIYYYAKDSDPDGSEMRLHFIDVTGVNNSSYAPSDGPELDADKVQTINGKIGKDYSFTYTVPKGYDQVATSDVTGKYSVTHHDAYVYVKKQAENKLYAPVASDPLTVEQGTKLTTGQAKDAVKYNGDVPSDATYAWDPKTPVDTATVGSYTPNVIVTYGDGTTSSVPVTVNVVAKTDKSKYTVAAGKPVTLTHGQKVKEGDSLDSSAVTLKDAKGQAVSLPDKAKVVWTTAPDTSEVGNDKTGQAKVVYSDKSESEPVTVTYNVTPNDAETNTPELITPAVDQNAPVDPTSVVTNQDKLPKGTTYSWTKEPNTETAGQPATGSLHVAYPDGSSEDVPVTVNVKSNKDQYQPELITPAVDQNAPVDPTSVVTNQDKLPKGTTYSWTKEPNTETAGQPATGSLHVAYPDGSSEDVPVTVNVKSNKDQYQPELITPAVDQNAPVDPTSVVTNQDKLPKGTTYSWTKEPNTETAGQPATGSLHVAYPDGSSEDVPVTVNVKSNKDQYQPELITPAVDQNAPVDPTSVVTNQDKLPKGTTYSWTKEPNTETAGQPATGSLHVAYPDGSSEDVPVTVNVKSNKDQYQPELITPAVDQNAPVDPTSVVTNQDKLPKGTTYSWTKEPNTETAGQPATGSLHVAYPDGSSEDVPVTVNVKSNKDQYTPTVPGDKVTVKDPSHLTEGEKNQVKNNVDNANKDKFPDGTTVTVGDDGTATVNYPDGSKDTIPGDQLVQGQKGDTTDAGNITPTVPGGKVTVKDPSHLTEGEKDQVKTNVTNANKDKFPAGTEVTVGDNGTATVTYPDGSKDTIPGDQLVQGQKGDTTDAGNITPTVPGGKVTVKDPSHLTEGEKDQVKTNVTNANKDKFPAGTEVTVGDNGTATVTYPDGSKDTIPGDQLVQGQKGDTTDAGNITPTVPGGKVTVKDPSHLTEGEKDQVKTNVTNANKDKFPAGTEVTVGDNGTATVTYPDGSKDTIPGDQLVQGQKGDTTDAGNITPTVPGGKVTVKDPSHLTEGEKDQVKTNVTNANKDKFPAGTEVTVGDNGTATVTYPDGSKDTIPGDQLVQGQKGDTTDAGNITPTVPGGKVTVKDPSHLTDDEKNQVKNNVDNANKDKFPDGTKVTVGDDGTATVTYPDGSKDTIPGDQLVQGQKGDTTDAGNITPTVPGDKVTVKDPSHLTDDEKNQVKNNVDNANKDKFPEGTTVTVGDDGTATITYPDGSKDTIPGDQLVQGQKGDTTDAGNITPNIPGTKVPVADPSHLTDDEKDQVKTNVTNANKDNLPSGSQVTVGNDGTTTTTYPDGSKDTIPGSDLVRQSTDADKITPKVPETKVPVTNPSQLTDSEKDQVKTNVTNANKDNLPSGSQVTVGNDGTTTTTYPDGSKDTIPGSDLVRQSTDADKTTPSVPGTKVPVTDPSHLTDSERDQVKTNVTNDNKDNLPSGSQITVGDDGTATITYPDGSKDTIPGSDLVRQSTDADKTTPSVPATKVPVTDPSHLTDDEKDQVKTNVTNANKDNLPSGSQVTVGNDGTTTTTYPDGSKDTIPGSDLVRQSTDADKITPKVPETKVPVTNPSQLTDSEKDQVKTNVTNANKDNLPSGSQVTVGNDGTTTTTYPDGSKDTIPGSDLVRQSTDADKTTPSVPGTKVPVTDPSHLTDSERDQVKTNVTNDNKDNLPSGSQITVGDDGTATITYPDGSKDTIPGRDLIKGISGNKHDSNSSSGSNGTISNTDDETSGDTVNNAESMNGNTAKSGSKNNSLKTLPQTGTKDVTILEILGLFLSLFGLLGLKKKHHEE
ncbi:Rib/alpha-like domain-containing protein [Limosilactobacillus reuteri]|uniref:Rib/alpha-like domain-containing protein n=1 Tax=Limosilactobacillus reuteri TaxID=1598 RepID=UPI0023603B6D|nr:Rib/alpha-like domain-containing protein [Limosilactobacillus reuteri]MDD1403961.1 Rib/alpha-like domain-containing protein [Limosilactobacillus reuteri]